MDERQIEMNGIRPHVANSIGDDVSLIDLAKGCEIKRLKSWRSPNAVRLSRDGSRVFVSNLLPHLAPYDQSPVSELNLIDTTKQIVAERVFLPDAMELRHVAEAPANAGGFLLVALMRPKNLNPLIQVQQGWFLTHGLGLIQPDRTSSTDEHLPYRLRERTNCWIRHSVAASSLISVFPRSKNSQRACCIALYIRL